MDKMKLHSTASSSVLETFRFSGGKVKRRKSDLFESNDNKKSNSAVDPLSCPLEDENSIGGTSAVRNDSKSPSAMIEIFSSDETETITETDLNSSPVASSQWERLDDPASSPFRVGSQKNTESFDFKSHISNFAYKASPQNRTPPICCLDSPEIEVKVVSQSHSRNNSFKQDQTSWNKPKPSRRLILEDSSTESSSSEEPSLSFSSRAKKLKSSDLDTEHSSSQESILPNPQKLQSEIYSIRETIPDSDSDTGNIQSTSSRRSRLKKKSEIIRNQVVISSESDDSSLDLHFSNNDIKENNSEDSRLLNFINTAPATCLKEFPPFELLSQNINNVLDQRPFLSIQHFNELIKKYCDDSIVDDIYISSLESLNKYKELDDLVEKCQKLGRNMRPSLQKWREIVYEKKEIEDPNFIPTQSELIKSHFVLKPYQIIGVSWLNLLYKSGLSGILADEMGLGKTAQVISFLAHLSEIGDYGPHLLVVPSSCIKNWIQEFERWCPKLNVQSYHGTQKERMEFRSMVFTENLSFDIMVTTYNVVVSTKDDRSFCRRQKFKSLILDEGHMVKNTESSRYRHLMSIRSEFRLLLTGTPLQNNLSELFALLQFILPDVFKSHEELISNTFSKKSINEKQDIAIKISKAKLMLSPFILRRRKCQVLQELPKKIVNVEYCSMTENQKSLYMNIIQKSRRELSEERFSKPSNSIKMFRNILMQLRKAACHPLLFRTIYSEDKIRKMAKAMMKEEELWDKDPNDVYLDLLEYSDFDIHQLCLKYKSLKSYKLPSSNLIDAGKVEKLNTLLTEHKKKGNRVLIFSQFTTMLDILECVMEEWKFSYLRLDGSTEVCQRQDMIDMYNESNDIFVFLLSTRAGGFGINLTSANVVILYDLDFNPHNDAQAQDRCHRVGQTREVTVTKLVTPNAVEQKILDCAMEKIKLDERMDTERIDGSFEQQENDENSDIEKFKLVQMVESELEIN